MRLLFSLLLLISFAYLQAQPFAVGQQTITLTDPARGNRSIPSEIFYPATSAGSNAPMASGVFPVIVFGHGFSMNFDAYSNFWNELVPKGYIIAFPKTEIGPIPFPSHGDLGADMSYTINWFIAENQDAASRYFQKVNGKFAVMGHSMGGGCSYLSTANNPNVTVIANFAAAETNPSAISAAANITVPALVFAGSKDCVAGPSGNQTPMYNALASTCKSYVNITDGSHCQFGQSNTLCSFGETTSCPFANYISRSAQHTKVFQYLNPFLSFYLKGDCTAWPVYQQLLASPTGATVQNSCNYQLPTASITLSGRQNLCAGETATLAANNGYTYWWTGGSTQQQITVGQTGLYELVVTDARGCKDTATQQINVAAAISANAGAADVLCNGGSDGTAWVQPTGGYGNFIYQWSGTTTSNDTAQNLAPGIYNITVTDGNNCTATASVTVAEPPALALSVAANDATCNGLADGNIFVQAIGGVGGYSYQWAGGASGQTLTNVRAGNYTVSVVDGNGCPLLQTVSILEPSAVQVQASITNANCGGSDGSASLTATGGTGGYGFLWPDGDTVANKTGLAAGSYSITATDANGCSVTYSVNISAPGTLAVNVVTTITTCPGYTDGTAKATVTGGTAPYTYNWQGQPAATGDSVSGYGGGDYLLTVTDSNGCVLIDTFNIEEPVLWSPPIVSLMGTELCEGDTSIVTPIDNYYGYIWNTGDTTQTIKITQAGYYNCTVTDGGGCQVSGVGVQVNYFQNYLNPAILLDGDSLYVNEGTVTAWFLNSVSLGVPTGNYLLNPAPGGYFAQVVDSNGCYYIAKAYTVTVGIDGISSLANIRVYPNPASAVLYVDGLPTGATVQLIDLLGRRVLSATDVGNGQTALEVSNLPAQPYLLQVVSGENRYIRKVFIAH